MRDEIRERRRRAADEYLDRDDRPDGSDPDELANYYHNQAWASQVYYKDAMADNDPRTAVKHDRTYGFWREELFRLQRQRERS